MITCLLSEDGFNLPPPKMIISVTGGMRKNFNVDESIKASFKLGLIKSAISTNAWIVTAGTNVGVSSLVGDAVEEDLHARDLTVLGIANWGIIADRDNLIVKNHKN